MKKYSLFCITTQKYLTVVASGAEIKSNILYFTSIDKNINDYISAAFTHWDELWYIGEVKDDEIDKS